MADRAGGARAGFRIVPPGEPPAPRARRPGPAVLLVLVYAALFGAGLWWFRARSPLFRARTGSPRAASASTAGRAAPLPPPTPVPSSDRRRALLAGEGLPAAAAGKYARRLSSERCTCGCDLAVNVCLARDASCARSPEIAERIRDTLR